MVFSLSFCSIRLFNDFANKYKSNDETRRDRFIAWNIAARLVIMTVQNFNLLSVSLVNFIIFYLEKDVFVLHVKV